MEERFILDELTQPVYNKWTAKYQAEIKNIRVQLENCSVSSSNLKDCVNYTMNLSTNLLKMWQNGDIVKKQNLQELIFPEGIWYNRELDRVRTERVNSFFSVIPTMSNHYIDKKQKGKHFLSTSPRWVGPAVQFSNHFAEDLAVLAAL